MTTSFNEYISGSIFVIPESAYGALAAIFAFAAAFMIYTKYKRVNNTCKAIRNLAFYSFLFFFNFKRKLL